MRIACLLHAPFEGPGTIEKWALERGHEFNTVRVFDGEALPETGSFDLLVVMGGPMSVHDEGTLEWMKGEKALVRRCVAEGVFVLGICLGSQMLAEALGARVRKNGHKEIGWFEVERVSEGGLLGGLPAKLMVFHWHGETYDVPAGMRHAARSAGCVSQAFEGERALGLQFHLEMTGEDISSLGEECTEDIGNGPYEQTVAEMAEGAWRCAEMQRMMAAVLDGIEKRISSR
jgi:GMP synthase-like glutamine amidotransferase